MRLLICIVIATSVPGKCESADQCHVPFHGYKSLSGNLQAKELQEQVDQALRDIASFCCIFKQMLCSSARDPLINILAVDYANVYTPHTIQPIC